MAEFIAFELLTTLPFHLFAYVPFWQKLRFSKKFTAIMLALVEVIYLAAACLLVYANAPQLAAHAAAILIFGTFFLGLVKENLGKIMFLYIFTTDYILLVRGAALYLQARLSSAFDDPFVLESGLFALAFFLFTLPFMLRYFLKTSRQIMAIKAPSIWKFIWLLPTLISATVLAATHPLQKNLGLMFLLSRVLLMLCMFLIYYNVIQLVSQTLKQQEDAAQIRHLEQIAQIQADQYLLLQNHITETRRARHDLRQHLLAVQSYIEHGDVPALASYIKKYGESLPIDSGRIFSQNTAIDAVLRFYAERASAAGIDIDIVFPADSSLAIPEPELCVLLGNLLENALENCSSEDGRPFIRMRAAQIGVRTLSVTIDNSCTQAPLMENGLLYSRKHGGLGIGTESVRITAEKYHGHARFEWKDGVFFTSVLLNL